jgi:hypothetical protein
MNVFKVLNLFCYITTDEVMTSNSLQDSSLLRPMRNTFISWNAKQHDFLRYQ